MHLLNNIGIRKKLWLIIGFALAGLVVVMAISLTSLKKSLLDEKSLKTKHVVETAYGVVSHFHALAKDGKMPEDAAKAAAIGAIRSLRYEEKEYFWINDFNPTMVMHPYKPELDGKDLSDLKDPDGNKVFVKFVDTVKTAKAGYVYYKWPKPGEKEPVLKVSYVKGFEPWGWVIGSGIYLDDVQLLFLKKLRDYALAGAVLFICLVAVAGVIAGNITGTIKKVSEDVNLIANGDLRISMAVSGNDEAGMLAKDMNKMVNSLNSMINHILASIANVVQTVDIVKGRASKTASQAQGQAEQASQLAVTAEEMNQTIADITRNASSAANISVEAMQAATKGKDVAEGAVETVNRVSTATAELSTMVESLNGRVGEIGEILTVIEDIADQTNLLALNASIEAARAGEQGRGFAVVADEVRALAERTIKATKEISGKIGAVQAESEQTGRSMASASQEVKKATEYIGEVQSVLGNIVDIVQNVRDQVTQIATAVEEQSAASRDMTLTIEKTSSISQDVEKMAREVIDAVIRLSSVDEEIRDNTSAFKTTISPEMMFELAKTDHKLFVDKIASCLHGDIALDPAKLPDHHTCRFGKWYDSEGTQHCGTASSYKAIAVPHEKIHSVAKQAVAAMVSGDKEQAARLFAEAEKLSVEIVDLLDTTKKECCRLKSEKKMAA